MLIALRAHGVHAVALLAMTATASVSAADLAPRRDRPEVMYSAIGLSRVSTDFENVEEAISLDSVMGFRIPKAEALGVELNLGFTVIPGETSPATGGSCGPLGCTGGPNETSSSQDFQALTLGAFATLRTPGNVYAMGKLGYRYINSNLPELDENRSGSAWGAGGGFRYNDEGDYVELGYMRWSGEIDTLGLSFGF